MTAGLRRGCGAVVQHGALAEGQDHQSGPGRAGLCAVVPGCDEGAGGSGVLVDEDQVYDVEARMIPWGWQR